MMTTAITIKIMWSIIATNEQLRGLRLSSPWRRRPAPATRSKKLLCTFCCGSGTRTPIPCSRGMCPTIRRTRNTQHSTLLRERSKEDSVLLPSEPSHERVSARAHARRTPAESPQGLPLDEPAIGRGYAKNLVYSTVPTRANARLPVYTGVPLHLGFFPFAEA